MPLYYLYTWIIRVYFPHLLSFYVELIILTKLPWWIMSSTRYLINSNISINFRCRIVQYNKFDCVPFFVNKTWTSKLTIVSLKYCSFHKTQQVTFNHMRVQIWHVSYVITFGNFSVVSEYENVLVFYDSSFLWCRFN